MSGIFRASGPKMIRKLAVSLGVATVMLPVIASGASAAPFYGGNYGIYKNEGSYPTVSGCAGTYREIYRLDTGGQGATAVLRMYYSSVCGAYARIDNVNSPSSTTVTVRLNRSNNGDKIADGYVGETVDRGLNYAYTKLGNNLNGRVAQAQVTFEKTGARSSVGTGWY
jgi:hypothetical protein